MSLKSAEKASQSQRNPVQEDVFENSESGTLNSTSKIDPNSTLYKFLNTSARETQTSTTNSNSKKNGAGNSSKSMDNVEEKQRNVGDQSSDFKKLNLNAKSLLLNNKGNDDDEESSSASEEYYDTDKNNDDDNANNAKSNDNLKKSRVNPHENDQSFSVNTAYKITQFLQTKKELENDRSADSDNESANGDDNEILSIEIQNKSKKIAVSLDKSKDKQKKPANKKSEEESTSKKLTSGEQTAISKFFSLGAQKNRDASQSRNELVSESQHSVASTGKSKVSFKYNDKMKKDQHVEDIDDDSIVKQKSLKKKITLKTKPIAGEFDNHDEDNVEEDNGEEFEKNNNSSQKEAGFNSNGFVTTGKSTKDLGSIPSVVGKINKKTGQLETVDDEPSIPYGKLWILEHVKRFTKTLTNPIFSFLRETAGKVNSNPDAYLVFPDSTFSGPISRNVTSNFFKNGKFGNEDRERKKRLDKLHQENDKKIEENIKSNEKIIQLENELRTAENVLIIKNRELGIKKLPNGKRVDIDNADVPLNIEERSQKIKEANDVEDNINALTIQIKNEKEKLRQMYHRETITSLLSDLDNPENPNKLVMNFLNQLSKETDPRLKTFISKLEEEAIANFSDDPNENNVITDERANAQRLWLLAPENLEKFFWDGRFASAIKEAKVYIFLQTGKKYNTFHLMTDEIVSDLFSMMVAEILKRYRSGDGSRNITKIILEKQEANLVALAKKFNIVSKGLNGATYISSTSSKNLDKRKYNSNDPEDKEEVLSSKKKRHDSEFSVSLW